MNHAEQSKLFIRMLKDYKRDCEVFGDDEDFVITQNTRLPSFFSDWLIKNGLEIRVRG